jgi:presenilin-like A22 family membrane protease
MLSAVKSAQRLDWRGWLIGAAGASISGGAVVLSGISLGVRPATVVTMAGISALVSLGKYLETHPIAQANQGSQVDG